MNNMPPITKNLIIINALLFFAMLVGERYGIDLSNELGLHFFLANDFKLYQLFTYMFMHASFSHILFNMFAVWMFGRVMESYWGARRFLLYYIICGVGAGMIQELAQYSSYLWQGLDSYDFVMVGSTRMPMDVFLNRWSTVGASGAVYGILLAFGMTFPEERLFVFPLPVPIRAKFFVMGYAVIELLSGLGNQGDGVAHFAHLGGMIFGFLLIMYWRRNNGGRSYYGSNESVLKRVKKWVADKKNRFSSYRKPKMTVSSGGRRDDYEYNARKKAESEEIDRILAKVKKDGYQNLTDAEKRRLFDASQK